MQESSSAGFFIFDMQPRAYDVAVVGAGVFGAWTAHALRRSDATVALLDAHGPANSRASSGGESRVIRMGYGPDEIYTRWSIRALALWKAFFERVRQPLFRQTGVLWISRENDPYSIRTLETLTNLNVCFERLQRQELALRYPQIAFGEAIWGILEPGSGTLMARRAVQEVVRDCISLGVRYFTDFVLAPSTSGRLAYLRTLSDATISAGKFVFACGPWLPKLFPELLGKRIRSSRQEVFFFGTPPGDARFEAPCLPVWIEDFGGRAYGFPSFDNQGVKVAFDRPGPDFDPDTGERWVSKENIDAARQHLERVLPTLAGAPLIEARVCQYENTSSRDFLFDRHPEFENVWIVGGGSGHGFKHGPVVGEYAAEMVLANKKTEPRFALDSKARLHKTVNFDPLP